MSFKYPLQIDPFSLLDKAKVASFILMGNRLTQGTKVREYESIWEKYTGSKYAVFVNSGSSANFLIAQRLKEKILAKGEWRQRKTIVFPALTWSTSITPFLLLGFKPHFIDIDRANWGLDYGLTHSYLTQNQDNVAAVFPTALLGMNFDDRFFKLECSFPNVSFMFDGCEASFNRKGYFKDQFIVNGATSTTSTFFAHYANSIEGGLIFCDNEEDYAWYLMARNHGLVRALYPYADKLKRKPEAYRNKNVHKEFDFNVIGSNLRNTDINAYFGILDSAKWSRMLMVRHSLARLWEKSLSKSLYHLPEEFIKSGNMPFALPIIVNDFNDKDRVQMFLMSNNIESRPIISGSLRFQKVFRKYMQGSYPVADYLHTNGLYIGLNTNLKEKDIIKITKGLNNL